MDNDNIPAGGKILDFSKKPEAVDKPVPVQKSYTITWRNINVSDTIVDGYLFVTPDFIAVGNSTGEPHFMTYPELVQFITAADIAAAA